MTAGIFFFFDKVAMHLNTASPNSTLKIREFQNSSNFLNPVSFFTKKIENTTLLFHGDGNFKAYNESTHLPPKFVWVQVWR